ncbi:MAG: hypothetical protein H6Q46_210, partial [Deltaproteobacteria bacterium]|nr:hypothetical protein [Deltaproteobacteria bacterium]
FLDSQSAFCYGEELIIDHPEYCARVLDAFNAQDKKFLRLFTDSEIMYFININHVCQAMPS